MRLFHSLFTSSLLIVVSLHPSESVFCFKCESYRDFRCLDPFDPRPHVRVNCDYEPFVRERKPVFCEKTTELVDGVYVTTRGCSNADFNEVAARLDHRQRSISCFRSNTLEKCVCDSDNCNGGINTATLTHPTLIASLLCVSMMRYLGFTRRII